MDDGGLPHPLETRHICAVSIMLHGSEAESSRGRCSAQEDVPFEGLEPALLSWGASLGLSCSASWQVLLVCCPFLLATIRWRTE